MRSRSSQALELSNSLNLMALLKGGFQPHKGICFAAQELGQAQNLTNSEIVLEAPFRKGLNNLSVSCWGAFDCISEPERFDNAVMIGKLKDRDRSASLDEAGHELRIVRFDEISSIWAYETLVSRNQLMHCMTAVCQNGIEYLFNMLSFLASCFSLRCPMLPVHNPNSDDKGEQRSSGLNPACQAWVLFKPTKNSIHTALSLSLSRLFDWAMMPAIPPKHHLYQGVKHDG